MDREFDDNYNEAREEAYQLAKRRRSRSCSDGYCGADDCETCRPGCTRELENEDD